MNFIFCFFAMKGISWGCSPAKYRNDLTGFLATPYLSVRSLKYPTLRARHFYPKFFSFGLPTFFIIILSREYLSPLTYWEIVLLSPTIYFFTEAIGALGQMIFSWVGPKCFSIHLRPLTSSSLGQFWGHRWNLWVQDWLKDINRRLRLQKRTLKIFVTFMISGLFHEIMVNLPYWCFYGKSYFGTMMLYFLIQSLGLWTHKKLIKHLPPLAQKAFLWVTVILPSPLFINVPLLTFLGLHDG